MKYSVLNRIQSYLEIVLIFCCFISVELEF